MVDRSDREVGVEWSSNKPYMCIVENNNNKIIILQGCEFSNFYLTYVTTLLDDVQ